MSSNAKAEQPLSLYCGAARESSITAASHGDARSKFQYFQFNFQSNIFKNIRFPITVYITL
jgi:hypothetical protein